ncbi:MAG: nucleotide sugar dehydrogenase [Ignavibacteria bacterium]|jgi:UDP-N-acetyl-D-glucosamine dehydrogenase
MRVIEKIDTKQAVIGIIGLGYVGLPLALAFIEKGFKTYGFDVDEKKIPILWEGKTYIKHISSTRIKNAIETKLFTPTSDFSFLPSCDVVIICVPTPLNEHREPDITYVEDTSEIIAKYLRCGQLITLESTTYPGTTEEIILPKFENAPIVQGTGKNKFVVGEDFYLAYSPEREDPNNPNYTTATIPKVVGGVTNNCLEVAIKLYNQIIVQTVPVSTTRAAEATKLLENIYRSVNIALVNELKMVFHRMDIDIWEVIEAAKTKPFGYHAFYPGPGLGGHCIPIDPFYLTWKAREYEVNTKFIELAGEINTMQPYYIVTRAMEVLNEVHKSLKGSKVLILGVAYKKNVDDTRESPSLKLIEILREKGADVDYNDPHIQRLPKTRKYNFEMNSIELTEDNIKHYDLVLLSTDHDDYDYEQLYKCSNLILDTRNAFKLKGLKNGKVIKS